MKTDGFSREYPEIVGYILRLNYGWRGPFGRPPMVSKVDSQVLRHQTDDTPAKRLAAPIGEKPV